MDKYEASCLKFGNDTDDWQTLSVKDACRRKGWTECVACVRVRAQIRYDRGMTWSDSIFKSTWRWCRCGMGPVTTSMRERGREKKKKNTTMYEAVLTFILCLSNQLEFPVLSFHLYPISSSCSNSSFFPPLSLFMPYQCLCLLREVSLCVTCSAFFSRFFAVFLFPISRACHDVLFNVMALACRRSCWSWSWSAWFYYPSIYLSIYLPRSDPIGDRGRVG